MRSARLLVVLGLTFAPAIAAAQEKNPFTDSWFWGAKAGMVTLNTSNGTSTGRTNAPEFGVDWLITRSWYALNVSLDQAYFNAVSSVINADTSGVQRRVDIRDMRRATVAMDLFPKVFNESVRPYVGIGYSFNFVVRAESEGTQYVSPAAKDTVDQRIQSAKSRASAVMIVGVQADVKKWAPFAQATVMPTQGALRKFLINGTGFTYYVEAGIRYNFGGSIEKMK
jgi:outer membrane protein W